MMIRTFPALLLASLLAACGGANNQEGMPDMTEQPDLTPAPPDMLLPDRAPTDHPPLLTMTNNGGGVLKAPAVYTVVWSVDATLGTQVEKFTGWMLGSDYFTKTLAEYGVGAGRSMGLLQIAGAAPTSIDDSQFTAIVQKLVTDNNITVDNNTAFSFILNAGTKSTLQGARGCYDYGGYHDEVPVGSHRVPVLVSLQCSRSFDELTFTLSHEVAEAATDPRPFSAPGYVYSDFGAPMGGEIGDLCDPLGHTETVTFPDATTATYQVTRLWSNKAATAGNADPCQPVAADSVYFNVAMNPTVPMVDVPASGTSVFEGAFEPYAFGDVGVIKWQVMGAGYGGVTLSPSRGSGHAGETVRFTITIDPSSFDPQLSDQLSQYGNAELPIDIEVQSASGGRNQFITSIVLSK